MTPRRWCGLGLAGLALALAGLVTRAEGQNAANKAEPIRIGMANSLFTDVPQVLMDLMGAPFSQLMKASTGLDGKFTPGGEVYDVARKLYDKKLDLAVFHAVEFGWAQQKYSDLQPLMLAINRHRKVRAFLVVKADGDIKSFADLKSKTVSLPRRSKLHSRLFLDRGCAECGQANLRAFFQDVVASPNIEVALDDVLRGKIQAVITDTHGLEHYDAVKPGCCARLKVVQQSELFPGAVVAFRKGALDQATLKKVKDGMVNADKDERCSGYMRNFQMSGFEAVHGDFAAELAELLKAYPPPPETKTAQK
jgi:ABC-type phosphate/phosphonate transport system substrate-binding protein